MMRALTAQQILELWMQYSDAHPVDRTLAMLSAGLPAELAGGLPELPVGSRERQALALRGRTFGQHWEGLAACPGCGELHEVTPPIAAMLAAPEAPAGPVQVRLGDYEACVRVPSSRDQAAVFHCAGADEAQRALLARCVLSVTRAGASVAVDALPGEVIAEVAASLVRLDPNAETLLELTCVGCGQAWTLFFDAGEFLWRELVVHARRLLKEVHALAQAYGWGEAEILGMPPYKREAYLELVGA